jgi:alkylmercury lyase
MHDFTVDEVIQAWTSQIDDKPEDEREAIDEGFKLSLELLRLLAEGRPVSARKLATQVGLPLELVEAALKKFKKEGGEFDKDGNLVGAALTLNPTPHRFRLDGQQLYTWCSLDAIFMPGLLGKTAEVESTCPVTGEAIRLTIAPDGIVASSPEQAVLSITIPGVSCAADDSCSPNKTGPQSDACNQMHFFSSREAAEIWLVDHPGVVIFSLDEAFLLAKENWIDRFRALQSPSGEQRSVTRPAAVGINKAENQAATCGC